MESLVKGTSLPDPAVWKGRSVLITGHTGFKGGWLTHWLTSMGAVVHGLALDPATKPSLFELSSVASLLRTDTRGDISNLETVNAAFATAQPEVVIHMAAQPLVRESYTSPVETFETNVMGTVNVLEAVRRSAAVKAVVVVTTDKVYRNREWPYPYRELDELGGNDPYSASKAASEFAIASFRQSYFSQTDQNTPRVVSVRAGNVIGGGDWSRDRLVPDIFRAVESRRPLRLRSPYALRPWQHVLDPICGYLLLAESLLTGSSNSLPSSWNFGPDVSEFVSVTDLVERLGKLWERSIDFEVEDTTELHESQVLTLDSTLALRHLNWKSQWSLQRALQETIDWMQSWMDGDDMARVTNRQISAYATPEPLP